MEDNSVFKVRSENGEFSKPSRVKCDWIVRCEKYKDM